jgi:hypothetical protein
MDGRRVHLIIAFIYWQHKSSKTPPVSARIPQTFLKRALRIETQDLPGLKDLDAGTLQELASKWSEVSLRAPTR